MGDKIGTVKDMIEALKKCNPKDKITVRPNPNAYIMVVTEPGGGKTYLDVVLRS